MFCTHCGAQVAPGSQFCNTCGRPVNPSAPPAFSPSAQPSPTSYAGTIPVTLRVLYAGFWLRFLASLIDGLVLAPVVIVFVLILFAIAGGTLHMTRPEKGDPAVIVAIFFFYFLFYILMIVGNWLYFAMCECSSWQATLGKKALNIQVTDLDGRRISFGRASGRFFGKILSGMILNIGYIMAGFTEKKQALHDMIAGCLVLRR